MRLADERFNASIMMSISMIESLTGGQQDWTTNTSRSAHIFFDSDREFRRR